MQIKVIRELGNGLVIPLWKRNALWELVHKIHLKLNDLGGLVRKAKIKTATSSHDRPIHKLCLIATKEELSN